MHFRIVSLLPFLLYLLVNVHFLGALLVLFYYEGSQGFIIAGGNPQVPALSDSPDKLFQKCVL